MAGILNLLQLDILSMNSLGKSMILGLRTTCQHLNKTKFYTWVDITMKSRVVRDGCNIDDLLKQIESTLSDKSRIIMAQRMTAIQSITPRNDGYGNLVNDRAIFELTRKKPRVELFSVIPKATKTNRE